MGRSRAAGSVDGITRAAYLPIVAAGSGLQGLFGMDVMVMDSAFWLGGLCKTAVNLPYREQCVREGITDA